MFICDESGSRLTEGYTNSQAAEAQVGALVEDDDLPCPEDLAARATWPR
jgi:hypothetical protein